MEKKILIFAAVLGVTSIILGAFGAHALKKVLTIDQLNSFEVGVRYQMYHALFLLFVSQCQWLSFKDKNIIFYLVIIGVVFFSLSIYLLSCQLLLNLKLKFLGPLTPIGGMFLISAWLYLIYCIFSKKM